MLSQEQNCPSLDECDCDWHYVGVEQDGQLVCETDCGLRYCCGSRWSDEGTMDDMTAEERQAILASMLTWGMKP